ncbi:hypothetical protein DFP72DRAFT_1079594 [Ephemerocybe angulata]|uniref:Uncharacterized protein n=1 Tax=Ephemerocybe angulata TaxID=980116 RepID=A0A8H6HB78_9AGAR|nr:hypothetical protein DFP72DRAFT_1079594 [Tulosesus angulatus]
MEPERCQKEQEDRANSGIRKETGAGDAGGFPDVCKRAAELTQQEIEVLVAGGVIEDTPEGRQKVYEVLLRLRIERRAELRRTKELLEARRAAEGNGGQSPTTRPPTHTAPPPVVERTPASGSTRPSSPSPMADREIAEAVNASAFWPILQEETYRAVMEMGDCQWVEKEPLKEAYQRSRQHERRITGHNDLPSEHISPLQNRAIRRLRTLLECPDICDMGRWPGTTHQERAVAAFISVYKTILIRHLQEVGYNPETGPAPASVSPLPSPATAIPQSPVTAIPESCAKPILPSQPCLRSDRIGHITSAAVHASPIPARRRVDFVLDPEPRKVEPQFRTPVQPRTLRRTAERLGDSDSDSDGGPQGHPSGIFLPAQEEMLYHIDEHPTRQWSPDHHRPPESPEVHHQQQKEELSDEGCEQRYEDEGGDARHENGGYDDGYGDGYDDGYNDGHGDGYEEGYEDALEDENGIDEFWLGDKADDDSGSEAGHGDMASDDGQGNGSDSEEQSDSEYGSDSEHQSDSEYQSDFDG